MSLIKCIAIIVGATVIWVGSCLLLRKGKNNFFKFLEYKDYFVKVWYNFLVIVI